MYVATFYSFKGGVGRSMALVNAAVELAQRGRKVLVVDFDLEAPGLDTFDILRPAAEAPGVIDFVGKYLASGQAPEIEGFVSESALDDLWIMRSGAQRRYVASFGQIDWQELYERRSGYLLFEDMKAQWRQVLQPDYVLIDSRTGHTDTCGICTRQLPDAVTILFFPNEQNLRGLTKVVRDIRAETEAPAKRSIMTHFVMSNVPDLDDEDNILRGMLDKFRADLGFEDEPHVIHRYDSLSLLNQVVFTRDRPRSRLAREYCSLVDRIVEGNLEDKEGALQYIKRTRRSLDRPHDLGQKFTRIEQHHAQNGEVLLRLGELASEQDDWERAKPLLQRAVELRSDDPRILLAHARVLDRLGEGDAAADNARQILQASSLGSQVVWDAIRLARLGADEEVTCFPAVASLAADGRIWLASQFERSGQAPHSVAVLRQVLREDVDAHIQEWATGPLALVLIGTGQAEEARELLGTQIPLEEMSIQEAFSYGIAMWGCTGKAPREPFEQVVKLNESEGRHPPSANYLQCMAVAYWAVGKTDLALDFACGARQEAQSTLLPTFSCWRYGTVSADNFLQDTDNIVKLINGDKTVVPPFVQPEYRR